MFHIHLVYGHLSAWGLVGPDRGDPGYDFGAFWAQTGMASLCNSQGHYAQYPGAFGDTIAGSNLVSGIAGGIRIRLSNGGVGCYVETSLLRTGMWVMAPMLSRAAAQKAEKGGRIIHRSLQMCDGRLDTRRLSASEYEVSLRAARRVECKRTLL